MKGGNAYYNVTLASTSIKADDHISDALAMPETASGLNLTNDLGFGQYDTDALAGSYLDPASDKLSGESCSGLLASL